MIVIPMIEIIPALERQPFDLFASDILTTRSASVASFERISREWYYVTTDYGRSYVRRGSEITLHRYHDDYRDPED